MSDATCDMLKREAMESGGDAVDAWRRHAGTCGECDAELRVLDQLTETASNLRRRLPPRRAALLRDALAMRRKERPKRIWIRAVWATAACVLIAAFAIHRLSAPKSATRRASASTPRPSQSLEWNCPSRVDDLRRRLTRLKSTLSVERSGGFIRGTSYDVKLRSIRSKIRNLRKECENENDDETLGGADGADTVGEWVVRAGGRRGETRRT